MQGDAPDADATPGINQGLKRTQAKQAILQKKTKGFRRASWTKQTRPYSLYYRPGLAESSEMKGVVVEPFGCH
jgi:hypothetical protein